MDIKFVNDVGMKLAARLEWPEDRTGPVPVVIFAHGFDSGKDSTRGMLVAARLRSVGIATSLIDFTGHGDSDGSKHESTIERQVNDLKAAIDYVSRIRGIDSEQIGLCGASSGGLVALMTSMQEDRVRAVALRGPRTDGMTARAHVFKMPILIVQGSRDPLLGESENFFRALPGNKTLKVVPGADHLFSGPGQIEEVAKTTARWFRDALPMQRRNAA